MKEWRASSGKCFPRHLSMLTTSSERPLQRWTIISWIIYIETPWITWYNQTCLVESLHFSTRAYESSIEFSIIMLHLQIGSNYIYIIQISHICEVQCSRKSLMDGIFCRPFRATVEPPRTLFSHACVHGTVNFAVKPNRRANKHGTNMYGTKVSACQSSNKDASVMLRREW